jgi:carboxyl-terminal processing protease
MNRRADFAFWTFVALGGIAAITIAFNVSRSYSATSSNSEIYGHVDRFGDVLQHVREYYVDTPDDAMLIENAIKGMVAGLDPHSSYLNAKSYGEMQVETRGRFGGLGIEVTMEQGLLKVVSPIDESPAAKAGGPTGQRPHHPHRRGAGSGPDA